MNIESLFPLFSSETGVGILVVYGLFAFAMTYWYSRGYDENKTSFLVARRELNTFQGSLSVAAAWLWAPGLFISTQQAYVNGLVGLVLLRQFFNIRCVCIFCKKDTYRIAKRLYIFRLFAKTI